MVTEEFKAYQKSLNRMREAKLKEGPLPKAKALLEPDVTFNIDISDLTLENLPIHITEPIHHINEEKIIKSNSKSLF